MAKKGNHVYNKMWWIQFEEDGVIFTERVATSVSKGVLQLV